MDGTPIDQLRILQQMQQNPQMAQAQQMPPMQQMQQPPYNMGNNGNNGKNRIDVITQDITDSLDDMPQMSAQQQPQLRPQYSQQEHLTVNKKTSNQSNKSGTNSMVQKVPEMLREPLLLLIIYVVMSLDPIKNTIAEYVPQIKPKSDGSVFIVGYIIYGIFIAVVFTVMKKLLL